ncbi:AraC family transcriptional regulator [Hydrogenophaga soli]
MDFPLLTAWVHTASAQPGADEPAWIPPDGCQDLIGVQTPDGVTTWHVFALAQRAETVCLPPGVSVRGYRLHPGSQVDDATLLALTRHQPFEADAEVRTALAHTSRLNPNVQEALHALAHAPSVAAAAHSLGVSLRTLERLTHRHTQQTPGFWRGLARVRQAARALTTPCPLAELAVDHGFSDQAHMNLAFRHWLGCTPTQLRASPDRLALLHATGHG